MKSPRPHEPDRTGPARRNLAWRIWRPDVEDEVDAELGFHFEMTVRELMEAGMTNDEARTEAQRRFGNVDDVAARCEQLGRERDRNHDRAEWRAELSQDVRFGVRQLARAKSFTAVAVLTLALGVGATAAVFSALDAVVLRPLPFDHPDRVVTIFQTVKREPGALSPAEFLELRDHAAGFDRVSAALLDRSFTITDGDVPELVQGGRVSRDYFDVFGAHAELGRGFDAAEEAPGHEHVVVISHKFWLSHFNGDRGVVGRPIHLDEELYTIIGVMPASLDLRGDSEDMWGPLVITPADAAKTGAHYLRAFGRVRAGVTVAQAREQATNVIRGLAARAGDSATPISDRAVRVTPFAEDFIGDYRSLLYILLGAVSFVLLIACTNVANLLLSRGTTRARELAIRAALGAGRARLVRQLLTESLVLAMTGAVLSLGVAYAILRGVRAISPEGIPRLEQASIDWRVLAFTVVLAVVCALVFGLVPSLRAAGPSLQGTLRESGRGSVGAGSGERLRSVLVATEVALAMTLLAGAGLLIRSAWLVQHVDPGFDPRGVLTSRILLPQIHYSNPATIVQTFGRIRDEAAAIPGVRLAALGSVVPLSGSSMNSSVRAEGTSGPETAHNANLRLVSPEYFAAMGIPKRAGRDLTPRDDAAAPLVVMINEALARTLWPGQSPASIIGKRIDAVSNTRSQPMLREVVGIVGDLHDQSLTKAVDAEFYLPVPQTPDALWPFLGRSLVVVLKAANPDVDALSFRKPLEQAVAHVDHAVPLADAKTMNEYVRSSFATARFNTILLSALGAIALLLAMVGVYGVVSYFVTQRTQEIGIRQALGATPAHIWQHVVRRGLSPIVVGAVVGLVLSTSTAGVLRSRLFGVQATDPATFAGVGGLLLLVSLVATYFPARRAMRLEPVVALSA